MGNHVLSENTCNRIHSVEISFKTNLVLALTCDILYS